MFVVGFVYVVIVVGFNKVFKCSIPCAWIMSVPYKKILSERGHKQIISTKMEGEYCITG